MAALNSLIELGRSRPKTAAMLALAVVVAGWTTVWIVSSPEPAAHEYVSWGPPEGGIFLGLKLLRYSIQYGIYLVVAGLLAKFFGLFGGSKTVPVPPPAITLSTGGTPTVMHNSAWTRTKAPRTVPPEVEFRRAINPTPTQETDVNEIVAAIGKIAEVIKQDRKDNEIRFAALEDQIKGIAAAVEKGNASELEAANASLQGILADLGKGN